MPNQQGSGRTGCLQRPLLSRACRSCLHGRHPLPTRPPPTPFVPAGGMEIAACGTCPICLAELDSSEEAFLDGCFHHFHLQASPCRLAGLLPCLCACAGQAE